MVGASGTLSLGDIYITSGVGVGMCRACLYELSAHRAPARPISLVSDRAWSIPR